MGTPSIEADELLFPELRIWQNQISTIALHCMALSLWLVQGGCRPATTLAKVKPATPALATSIFHDAAQEAGLRYTWGHHGKSPLNILETLGHGCAFLDYDHDGLLDVLLVGDTGCALYHNLGHGRFADVTSVSGLNVKGMLFGIAVGDYDNDGFPDIYITGYGKCVLYHNRGKTASGGAQPSVPIFEDVTYRAGVGARGPYDDASAAAFVDLDGDGKLDLFVGRYIAFTPKSIQLCNDQGILAGCGVKNYPADYPHVYRNNGNGTFTDVTKTWGFDSSHGRCLGIAVSAADTGGRGAQLYIANDEQPGDLFVKQNSRYINIGTISGTAFNHDGLTQGGMGTDWGDFLNAGHPGLAVATFQMEPKSVYRRDATNLYTEVSARLGISTGANDYVAWTAKFIDYDNDGWLDLFFTNGHTQDNVSRFQAERSYEQPLQLFHNEQGHLFREVGEQAGTAFRRSLVGRGAAIGDYDNDGRIDLLVVNEEGSPLLLHNDDRSGNHWLGVSLIGTQSNRDGVGARVQVTAGGQTHTLDQQLCGGYLSSHDPRLHFGLGTAKHVEKLIVHWPTGQVDTLKDVPIDTYIQVTEGKGLDRR